MRIKLRLPKPIAAVYAPGLAFSRVLQHNIEKKKEKPTQASECPGSAISRTGTIRPRASWYIADALSCRPGTSGSRAPKGSRTAGSLARPGGLAWMEEVPVETMGKSLVGTRESSATRVLRCCEMDFVQQYSLWKGTWKIQWGHGNVGRVSHHSYDAEVQKRSGIATRIRKSCHGV